MASNRRGALAGMLLIGSIGWAGLAPASSSATFTVIAGRGDVGIPVDLTWRPGDDALYVVGKGGTVVRLDGATPIEVLNLGDAISGGGEQGLLGLAFSEDGTHAYVNFTDTAGDTVVAELPVSDDGSLFDREAMRTLLTIDQPYKNHNGGDVLIGPDGYLYIPTGDGGDGGDPERRAMDLTSLLGKILRIDPAPSDGAEYSIPADNPYIGTGDARGEIWSIGLRNPWRVAFDAGTNDLWIADVGQNQVEEVNIAPAIDGLNAGRAVNFGWSAFEGNDVFNADVLAPDHRPPIFTYDHSDDRCSISGGVRVRGPGAGPLDGYYLFADFCSGEVMALPVTGSGEGVSVGEPIVFEGPERPMAVLAGPDGTIYVLARNGVNRLEPV